MTKSTHTHFADHMLLKAIAEGDCEAFDRFYASYSSHVFRIAWAMIKNKEDAEDICHDVFLDVIRRPEAFDPGRGSAAAWLAVKTKSKTLDMIRRKERLVLKEAVDRNAGGSHGPLMSDPTIETVLSNSDRESLLQALKHIPEAQRRAVYAAYFRQTSHREISEQFHQPLGTVKSLIRYGLKNLKKQLGHWKYPHSTGGARK